MEQLNNTLSQAMGVYYDVLSKTGKVPMKDVNNLLVTSIVNYIIHRFPFNITNEDLRTMANVLNCTTGNCYLPRFRSYENIVTETLFTNLNLRDMEDSNHKITEDVSLRILN